MDEIKNIKSVYIHIPFCLKKCAYCAFLSIENLSLRTLYINALIKEIKTFYKGEKLDTLYFGGGTPSLLEICDIKRTLECFNFEKNCEITLEVNPKTVDLEKLKQIRSLGINRISLGVQAFEDDLLKIANRTHDVFDTLKTIENIKLAGFENFSIDLIYGLPTQTMVDWKHSLDMAKSVGAKHISLYGLKIEEGTPFYLNTPKNLPDEDLQADMYEAAIEELKDWHHYEFSNFALNENYPSRHNLTYWKMRPYFGFGLGASGFIENRRYQNETNMEKYLKNPSEKKNFEPFSTQNLLEEEIFLGFRLRDGINVDKINKKFSIDFDEKYSEQLKKFENLGLIQKTLQGYKLTKKGILLSNAVLCEFLAERD